MTEGRGRFSSLSLRPFPALDLLGGRVGFTSSLPQLYFDYRLHFSMLGIITIPFYMNIPHGNLYAVNINTVWLVAGACCS